MVRTVRPVRSRQTGVTAAERALFREAMLDVVPLQWDRVSFELPPPPAIARSRERDEADVLAESLRAPGLEVLLEGGDEPAFLRPGLPRRVLKDLRRGRWVVQAEVDLHGYYRDEAHEVLVAFVARCLLRGMRCLRIVHGKGLGSPGREPVLKRMVLHWLCRRREVLAFCQAPGVDGGSGAVLVLLRAD